MSCFMSLCLSIWVVLVMPGRTSALTDSIDVMVMLPHNNTYMFSYQRVSPAIEYAIQTLGRTEPFAGLTFNVQYENSACGMDALYALVDKQKDERPDLVLGPVCEYSAASVVRVASHWNIPVISAGALATGFNSKTTDYSHLTRIAPTYLKMAETFQAMFGRFGWRTASLIYDDDKDERNCYFTIEGVFTVLSEYHHIATDFAVLNSNEERVDADGIITSVYGSEVVIMCAKADTVRDLMLAAHRRKLTSDSHIFFNIELFNSSSYGDGSWRRGDKYDNEAKAAYSFLNTVTLLRSTKAKFEDFSMEMKKSLQQSDIPVCEGCSAVNMFMEGFHDALILYAFALHEVKSNGLTKKDGLEITHSMWNRTFEGIAGQVSLDANGDRNGDFSVVRMTDPEAGTHETVMSYFGTNGSFQIMPGFKREWFSLRTAPEPQHPKHSDPSCGLGVSAVTGIIVGGILGTALLMAFYFFRKNYRITIERRTPREECDIGKHRQLREDSIRSNFSAA
ncbi:atrial natriuretic peptide receptor 3-like isoform X2 [Carassius gibelio]|uniref:atrial natriuretic peptide receptor 3-like isoform X2 n=1 Tax=Carassius gibelio TaxID=101364 RepID=UPI002278C36C|nr:atrial natriuretic peptide receptor 3-like isoform X2 [Carassius gibelio]